MLRWVITALCLCTVWSAVEGQMTIVEGGKARCVIVISPGATEAENYAAEALAATLREITGVEIPVQQHAENAPNSAIVVGPGALAVEHFPRVDLTRFGREELVISVVGRKMLLAGGRPRGTLYAVFRFLHLQCGVRWWTPWATTIPRRTRLRIAPMELREVPAFEARDPFWFHAFDEEWAVRNGSNSHHSRLTERTGGKVIYSGFVHTYYPLVPPERHFMEHPEWYSLIGGVRKTEGGQLCTTNPDLRAFIAQRVRRRLRDNPEASIVSVSQNDWHGACECERCRALDDAQGSHSATALALANYVGEAIKDEFPEVAVDTLAYQYTRKAPKDLRPLPNVIVRLCSIECNFAAPLENKSNSAFADDIRDWSRLSNRLYVWDYTTNFAHYILPHPNWFVLGPNVRFFHRHGVKGLFEQGAYQSTGAEMAELRGWLLAQLLWDPFQDDRKLIDEFLDGYYGKPSARYIRRYMRLMADAAKGEYVPCYTQPSAKFLSLNNLIQAEKLWQQAEAAARDNSDLLWRVKLGHLPVRYTFLARWTQLRRERLRTNAEWPLNASRKAVADEWLAVATGPGPKGWSPVTHINEGGVTPAAFIKQFEIDPPEPVIASAPKRLRKSAPPEEAKSLKVGDWVDAQDNLASLWNTGEGAEVQSDPTASDGAAVWMPGSHHEWAFQIPLDRVKPALSGRWHVYVAVRVKHSPGADANARAFTAGVYDTNARVSRGDIAKTIGDVSSGYRTYRLATVDAHKALYVWVAPPANQAVESVWVDRVFFVRAEE